MADASLTSEPEKLLPTPAERDQAERIVSAQCADWRWPDLSQEQLSEYWLAVDAVSAGLAHARLSSPVSGTDGSLRDSVAHVIDDPMMLTETKADQIIAMLSAASQGANS